MTMDHDADSSVTVDDGGDRASRSLARDDSAKVKTVPRPSYRKRAPAMLDGRMRLRSRGGKGDHQTAS